MTRSGDPRAIKVLNSLHFFCPLIGRKLGTGMGWNLQLWGEEALATENCRICHQVTPPRPQGAWRQKQSPVQLAFFSLFDTLSPGPHGCFPPAPKGVSILSVLSNRGIKGPPACVLEFQISREREEKLRGRVIFCISFFLKSYPGLVTSPSRNSSAHLNHCGAHLWCYEL